MSYQVLARKYRPQSFDQMIGQSHISQTLLNSLKNDRLPHALLFTGLRGTGKTSSARILAKTLRCENLQNLTPCHECPSCIDIARGSSTDVNEIDGASNNGVDAIRDLRESVMFMPTSGRYKIFIIDEVHMLSTSAFNALLKTLEEPPAHVIFMMATTEVQKIPQTILSRCQRFDLRRIPLKQLVSHLTVICHKENIKADEKALWLIAKQGDGSARDSLSLLDQVINFSDGDLTEASVTEILGLTDRQLTFEVFHLLLNRDAENIVPTLDKLYQAGVNPSLFISDLLHLIRHSLLLKSIGDRASEKSTSMPQVQIQETMIDLPSEEIELLKKLADTQNDSDLHMLFDMALKTSQDLHRTTEAFLVFEMGLLRMAHAAKFMDLKALFTASNTPLVVPPVTPASSVSKAAHASSASIAPSASKPISTPLPLPKPVPDAKGWIQFIDHLKKNQAFWAAKLENIALAGLTNHKISLQVSGSFAFIADQLATSESRQKIQGFIDSFFGPGYTFEIVKAKIVSGESAKTMVEKSEALESNKVESEILQDPRVQAAQKVFKATAKIVKP